MKCVVVVLAGLLVACQPAPESGGGGSSGVPIIGGRGGGGGSGGTTTGGCKNVCGTANCGACPSDVAFADASGHGIMRTEVTNAQYAAFLAAKVSLAEQPPECAFNQSFVPEAWPKAESDARLPAVGMDFCDAAAFCKWIGARLCGGVDGGMIAFDAPADAGREWVDACSAGGTRDFGYDGPYVAARCNAANVNTAPLVPVGSLSDCDAGYGGVFDLSGNAWEWENSCRAQSGGFDLCHVRGGAAESAGTATACSYSNGINRQDSSPWVGFRCCR